MNIVVIQGALASEPVTRTLASGSVVVSFELSTLTDDGTASVPVSWFDPPAEITWGLGEVLLVSGVVRRRFFRSGGATQSRTEVVASQVVPAARRRAARAVLGRAAAQLQADAA